MIKQGSKFVAMDETNQKKTTKSTVFGTRISVSHVIFHWVRVQLATVKE